MAPRITSVALWYGRVLTDDDLATIGGLWGLDPEKDADSEETWDTIDFLEAWSAFSFMDHSYGIGLLIHEFDLWDTIEGELSEEAQLLFKLSPTGALDVWLDHADFFVEHMPNHENEHYRELAPKVVPRLKRFIAWVRENPGEWKPMGITDYDP